MKLGTKLKIVEFNGNTINYKDDIFMVMEDKFHPISHTLYCIEGDLIGKRWGAISFSEFATLQRINDLENETQWGYVI